MPCETLAVFWTLEAAETVRGHPCPNVCLLPSWQAGSLLIKPVDADRDWCRAWLGRLGHGEELMPEGVWWGGRAFCDYRVTATSKPRHPTMGGVGRHGERLKINYWMSSSQVQPVCVSTSPFLQRESRCSPGCLQALSFYHFTNFQQLKLVENVILSWISKVSRKKK